MREIFSKFPTASRFILALLLGILALHLTGFIHNYLPVPFIDVTLLTIVTWVLYRTDGKSLKVLGLNITIKHLLFLALGLLIGIAALGIETFLRTAYTGERWHASSSINYVSLCKGFYFILPSIIVQELMFRGYLFTKTIDVTNVVIANAIFATLFMLVHVLDHDVLKNTGQLIFLAVSIPVGHLLFATALLKSKTLYFPIGLHWGNNWASAYLLGNSNSQNVIFYTTHQQLFTTWTPFILLLLLFNIFFLFVTFLIWKWDRLPFVRTLLPKTVLKSSVEVSKGC